jgi:gas vesicle protein
MDDRPEQLRRDIEQTRQELRRDTDALNEKVNPSRVVGRRVERTRHTMTRMKERVMGSADAGTTTVHDVGGKAVGTVESAGSAIAETAKSAPGEVRSRTEGNPLAAGLIAFSVGWLVSGILPATGKEKQLAQAVEDKGERFVEPVKQEATQVARDMKENLREPAQQAVDEVRETVGDATSTVRDEGQSATRDVTGTAKQSAENLRAQDEPQRRA